MLSLDTNVALRLLLGDVPRQAEAAKQLLASAKPGSVAVADVVFFEIAWVLSGPLFQFSRQIIGEMLLQITKIPQINCNRGLIERSVPLYISHSSLSFVDICLVVYAELNKAAPLLTYDKRLAKSFPGSAQLMAEVNHT